MAAPDQHAVPRLGTDPQSVRRRVEALERVMERLFVVPGLNRPVGLDVILDLVPVVGSTAAAAHRRLSSRGNPATSACRNGISRRMAGNIGVDWLLGLIPWVGAIPDFFFRSNTRNLRIIKRHLDKHHAGTRDDRGRSRPAARCTGRPSMFPAGA